MNAAAAAAAGSAAAGGDMSSYAPPGRPKRQTYRRANTDRIASSFASPNLEAALGAAAADDPYVSCATGIMDRFGGGSGSGSYGSGYYHYKKTSWRRF